jgi:hypothetical protein
MVHPEQKSFRILMLHGRERTADRILGPTLRVILFRTLEETVEGGQEVGDQLVEMEFARQISRFGHHEVVAIAQSFSQWVDPGVIRNCAERVQRGDLLFEFALSGHGCWQRSQSSIHSIETALNRVVFYRRTRVASFHMLPVEYSVGQNRKRLGGLR